MTTEELRNVVENAIRHGDTDAVSACIVRVSSSDNPLKVGFLERLHGVVCVNHQEHEKATEHFKRAIHEFESIGSHRDCAPLLWQIGSVHSAIGEYIEARQWYEQALTLYQSLGDEEGEALVMNSLGNTALAVGAYAEALGHYERAKPVFERLGNRDYLARVVGNLGIVFNNLGRLQDAQDQYSAALTLYAEVHDTVGQGEMTANIGNVLASQGDYPKALEYFQRALQIFEDVDDAHLIAVITGNIAIIYAHCGDAEKALMYNQRALAIHERNGRKAWIGRIHISLGNGRLKAGEYERALSHFHEALPIMQELGDREGEGRVRAALCNAYIKQGNVDAVRQELEHIDALCIENPQTLITVLLAKARLLEFEGSIVEATEVADGALKLATESNLRLHMVETHVVLRDLAQKRVDFAAYITHNDAVTKINDEIRGQEAVRKLAVHEAEQRMETERRERARERALLYGALPKQVADRLIRGEQVSGDHLDSATIVFLDIVGFTTMSHRIPAGHVVHVLEQVFSVLDDVCRVHDLTKIKTIGDSYMAASGVPEPQHDHAARAARAMVDMLQRLTTLDITVPPELGDVAWAEAVGNIRVRIGAHAGPVVAGVIGRERLQYDVWGDTVNVASRMESSCEPGRIQITAALAEMLGDVDGVRVVERGTIEVKGKGELQTFWLEPGS